MQRDGDVDDYDYDIIDNYDLYNFIYKINQNDIMSSEYATQSILNDDSTYVSYFDLIEYIGSIKKSYKDESSRRNCSDMESAIMTQFKKDYIRQQTNLNNVYDGNPDIFLIKLDALLKKYNYNKQIFSMSHYNLILLLLCQSSFVLPYTVLCNFYGLINGNKILSSGSQNRIMKIDINKESISIELNASLKIIDTLEEKTTDKIDMMITCDFKRNIDIDEPQFSTLIYSKNKI